MMDYSRIVLSILLLTGCHVAFAKTNTWKCASFDAENKMWSAQSDYQKSAINKSIAACKKDSAQPESCISSKSMCQGLNSEQSSQTLSLWRCSALDRNAQVWLSNDTPLRDEAALGAKDYCRSKSAFPDTCYINWFSCRNTTSTY